MIGCCAILWHFFYNQKKNQETVENERRATYELHKAKEDAKELGLSWPNVLTEHRERERIMAQVEENWKAGK
jgi:hypothetical protein